MSKKFKLNDTVIITFHDKSIPEKPIERNPNDVYFAASGCVSVPKHNNFYITTINKIQEVVETRGYYDDGCDFDCCNCGCNGEYVTYINKYIKYGNIKNKDLHEAYLLKKYSVKLHKQLCKDFDLKYTKHRQ
jgi:hypothetical protein